MKYQNKIRQYWRLNFFVCVNTTIFQCISMLVFSFLVQILFSTPDFFVRSVVLKQLLLWFIWKLWHFFFILLFWFCCSFWHSWLHLTVGLGSLVFSGLLAGQELFYLTFLASRSVLSVWYHEAQYSAYFCSVYAAFFESHNVTIMLIITLLLMILKFTFLFHWVLHNNAT